MMPNANLFLRKSSISNCFIVSVMVSYCAKTNKYVIFSS